METTTLAADIADWLMTRIRSTVVIRKEESGDVDQVRMTLSQVSYLPGDPDRDDYVEEDRLVLQGDGVIATNAEGGAAELPRRSYEIPLRPGFRCAIHPNGLELTTERAYYRITPQ